MPLTTHNQEILFTRQRHEAERAGLHYDYRIVVGDKAYSWATKKQLPEPGTSILLHEQPVHDASYALSQKVIIPTGQYGAGITTLDWVGKGRISNPEEDADKFTVNLNDGQRFLIKKLPEKYGPKAWLFKNLTKEEPVTKERLLEKVAQQLLHSTSPESLGIDLSKGNDTELSKWLIAVTLSSKPIQHQLAAKAANQMAKEGIVSPDAIQKTGYDGLVKALGRGHYVRYDFSMADTLLAQAEYLKAKYGTLQNMVAGKTPEQIREEIQSLKGIGPLGGTLFVEGLEPHLDKYKPVANATLTPVDARTTRLRNILVNSSRQGSFNPYSIDQYDWKNSKDEYDDQGNLIKFHLKDKRTDKYVVLEHPEVAKYKLGGTRIK
jgi:endonuclease III